MVTFDHIASCPGAIMPVAQMARVCKQRNVPTVLADAAHALGQVRLDLRALEAAGVTHFMADAHKWLYSPKGSAMLWVTREAQASMYPSVVGAVCSNSRTTNFDPAALANLSEFERRFQYTGTRDYTPLVAVADAALAREGWRERDPRVQPQPRGVGAGVFGIRVEHRDARAAGVHGVHGARARASLDTRRGGAPEPAPARGARDARHGV